MTATEREAHILGMIDALAGNIGAYLAQFTDEDQAAALPLAMMRLQGRMRRTWNEFVDGELDIAPEMWEMP